MRQQLLQHRPPAERRTARQHEKQGAPERVKVAPQVRRSRILGLFGRDVVEGAQCRAAGRFVGVRSVKTGQTHVHQFCTTVRQHDVGRFNVAMSDAPHRCVVEGIGHLTGQGDHVPNGHRPPLANKVTDVGPADVLKNDVMPSAANTDLEHLRDPGVVQLRGGHRFVAKPPVHLGVIVRHGNDLDRDVAAQRFVDRPEDDAHAAPADRLLDPEMVQPSSDQVSGDVHRPTRFQDDGRFGRWVRGRRTPRTRGFPGISHVAGTRSVPPLRDLAGFARIVHHNPGQSSRRSRFLPPPHAPQSRHRCPDPPPTDPRPRRIRPADLCRAS